MKPKAAVRSCDTAGKRQDVAPAWPSVFLSDSVFLLDWKVCFVPSSILHSTYPVAISTLAIQLNLLAITHRNSSLVQKSNCAEDKTAKAFHSSQMLICLAIYAHRNDKHVTDGAETTAKKWRQSQVSIRKLCFSAGGWDDGYSGQDG